MPEPSTADPTPSKEPPGFLMAATPVNVALIVVCVLVALWTWFGENRLRVLPLFISAWPADTGMALIEVRHGEIWRLFSPAFLHFGLVHLLLNMSALVTLGKPMEQVEGSRFYLGFTAAVALCSNLAQYAVTGDQNFGGMSGVIFGLFGFLWLRPTLDREYALELKRPGIIITLGWFAFCFTGFLPVANTAHAAGLGIGAVWGALSAVAARRQQQATNGLTNP